MTRRRNGHPTESGGLDKEYIARSSCGPPHRHHDPLGIDAHTDELIGMVEIHGAEIARRPIENRLGARSIEDHGT